MTKKMIVNIYLTLDFPKQNSIFANSYIKVTGGCLGGLNPVQISIQALTIIGSPLILVVTVFTVTQRYIISLSVICCLHCVILHLVIIIANKLIFSTQISIIFSYTT